MQKKNPKTITNTPHALTKAHTQRYLYNLLFDKHDSKLFLHQTLMII